MGRSVLKCIVIDIVLTLYCHCIVNWQLAGESWGTVLKSAQYLQRLTGHSDTDDQSNCCLNLGDIDDWPQSWSSILDPWSLIPMLDLWSLIPIHDPWPRWLTHLARQLLRGETQFPSTMSPILSSPPSRSRSEKGFHLHANQSQTIWINDNQKAN